jgi:lysophospholipase L1-like esterase
MRLIHAFLAGLCCAFVLTACSLSVPPKKAAPRDAAPPADSLSLIRAKMAAKEHITIVCLGDSVTEVNWTTRGHLNWTGLLQTSLFESGYAKNNTVINSGISGSTVTDALTRLDRDVLRFDPDLVIIGFGINDWLFFNIPAETTRANLRTLIHRIRESGNASILIRTPHHILNKETKQWDETQEFRDTLAVIREVAQQENITVVDHYAIWEGKLPADPDTIMYDWLHPNEVGHQMLFNDIAPVFGLKTEMKWMKK